MLFFKGLLASHKGASWFIRRKICLPVDTNAADPATANGQQLWNFLSRPQESQSLLVLKEAPDKHLTDIDWAGIHVEDLKVNAVLESRFTFRSLQASGR
jgi:hypothetical protein